MEKIIIYTDGGARGNPGPAGIGAVILDTDKKVLKEVSAYIGETTNNMAEYEALVQALEAAKELFGASLRDTEIDVRMDSELVVRQLNGVYKVKEPSLKDQVMKVAKIRMEDAPNITFTHVFREENSHADKLVNAAIDAAKK
jgi:ribonuclease HI